MLTTAALAGQILGLIVQGLTITPSLVEAAAKVKSLLTSGDEPTAEDEATIRAALDASEAELQK